MSDYDTWKAAAPEGDEPDLCTVAGCGQRATIDLTKTIHACSVECEQDLKDDLWCAECHALTAEGEDHADDCMRGWEAAALEEDEARRTAWECHINSMIDAARGK